MRDAIQVQDELAAAQADLESKVGQLKDLVKHKLATPRHVVEAIAKPISYVRAHVILTIAVLVGLGITVMAIRRRLEIGKRRR